MSVPTVAERRAAREQADAIERGVIKKASDIVVGMLIACCGESSLAAYEVVRVEELSAGLPALRITTKAKILLIHKDDNILTWVHP